VQRARDLGVPVDGWHVAAQLELGNLVGAGVDTHELRHRLSRVALATLREAGGSWHSARSGATLVLMRMHQHDPGLGACTEVAAAVDQALPVLRSRFPGFRLRCGVGGAHPGPAGLLASVAEAQAALTAGRADARGDRAIPFDSLGLRRSLVEWYATETAQEAVASVLAPLAALGPAKSERLIATLHTYLDQQGSLSRTAARLNLHRNAVAYRVNQIFSLLDVDRQNPDDLLLLQLACRARKLS
jgi:sugar diacid utilization regulator